MAASLDPAAILAEHRNIGPRAGRWVCAAGCESDGPCQPYQLAELAQQQAETIARVERWGREQAKPFADGVPDREGEAVWRSLRAELADHLGPESR